MCYQLQLKTISYEENLKTHNIIFKDLYATRMEVGKGMHKRETLHIYKHKIESI